jgi:hypothetical protein
MAGKAWTTEELDLLKECVEGRMLLGEIHALFLEQGYKRTLGSLENQRTRSRFRAQIPARPFSLAPALTLEEDKVLLLFDIHAPFQHTTWINRVIALAVKWGVTACGIGGDLVDLSSLCYWGRQIRIELQDELDAGKDVLKAISRNFEHKVLCGGNHERRLVRQLKDSISLVQALDQFLETGTNTKTTNRTWFWLRSGGQKFKVGHPRNYSKVPGRVPYRLAEKYHCHIITGHGHVWAQARDISDSYWVIDAGCCLYPKGVAWLEEEMSINPQPVMGAVIVMDGVPILLGERNIGFYENI